MMRRREVLAAVPMLATLGNARAAPDSRVLTKVDTAMGSFVIAVDRTRAPITVANYLAYVDSKRLDNGTVYRIVNQANQSPETKYRIEVVQWGMNNPDDQAPPLPAIAHETTQQTGLKHLDGTVSMARNGPGTAAAEFFICVGAQPELDFGGHRNPDGQGFAAFGQVVSGQAVVRQIHAMALATDQYIKPPIAVTRVRRVKAG